MVRIPSAAEMKLRNVMNDDLGYVLTDLQEKLFEGETSFELDILTLNHETKIALMDYLEDLGYFFDTSYGEDALRVSLND